MKSVITVREYAHLTTQKVKTPSLTRAHIHCEDFDWLCQLNQKYRTRHHPKLAEVASGRTLMLDSYVGVIETASGQIIEILPKTFSDNDDATQARQLLRQMLECALDLPPREAGEAALECFDAPLSEWVMARFLEALDHLIQRGVRFDYQRVEREEPFLRGQLDVARQMRQPPGRSHHFAQRYDLFLPDRAENRLLKLALEVVAKATQNSDSWRLAQELRHLLTDIPASRDIDGDFRLWREDRLMAHYAPVKPWCELILYRAMPTALQGEWRGISLLFPMEKLFERYVEVHLRKQLLADAKLQAQAASQYLCEHQGKSLFQLRPDLLLSQKQKRWVLDIKWKRLDRDKLGDKYDISQSDFYQLFAYGHKYLRAEDDGDLVLIYPAWKQFNAPLDPFYFDERLRLWVLPFEFGLGDSPSRLLLPETAADQSGRSLRLPLKPLSDKKQSDNR